MILERVDLTEPHGGGQTALQADIGLRLAGTDALRLGECAGDHLFELANARAIDLLRHEASALMIQNLTPAGL